jgi:hypothetical protein
MIPTTTIAIIMGAFNRGLGLTRHQEGRVGNCQFRHGSAMGAGIRQWQEDTTSL